MGLFGLAVVLILVGIVLWGTVSSSAGVALMVIGAVIGLVAMLSGSSTPSP